MWMRVEARVGLMMSMECPKLLVVGAVLVLHGVAAVGEARAAGEGDDLGLCYHVSGQNPREMSEGTCTGQGREDGTVGKGCHS